MVFMIEGFTPGLIFFMEKDEKPSASDTSEPGGIGFPPSFLVRESKSPNNFHWSP